MPARPGCGAGSTVGSAGAPGAGSPTGTTPPGGNPTGTPPLINDPSVGTSQTTTQNQRKDNPMAVPNTGGVGSGC
jgi:hypothetical protein